MLKIKINLMFVNQLNKIKGLDEVVKFYTKGMNTDPVLMKEFLLHGLAEFSQLSKKRLEHSVKFGDLVGSIFSIGKEEEEEN